MQTFNDVTAQQRANLEQVNNAFIKSQQEAGKGVNDLLAKLGGLNADQMDQAQMLEIQTKLNSLQLAQTAFSNAAQKFYTLLKDTAANIR